MTTLRAARSFLIAVFTIAALSTAALAQTTVSVIGPITPGDLAQFNSQTVLTDSGIPGGAGLFANPTGAVGLTAGTAQRRPRCAAMPRRRYRPRCKRR